MTATSEDVFIILPKEEWDAHKQRVEVCVATLNAVLSALAANPMFAGFIPADVRELVAQSVP